MTENKTFSLPEEISRLIDRYAEITRLSKSTIATMAFEDFMKKPEVKTIVSPEPQPATTQQ